MSKIAIIGANAFQNKLILKAKSMGYETHVFAWECGDVGERTADFFYPISIIEKEKILEICKKIKIDGICSIASDLATITVNYVANKMGLTCNPPEIIGPCTNKFKMRSRLKEAGIKCPAFVKVYCVDESIKALGYPLIVKPTDRSGSRSITKVYNEAELENAIARAVEDSFENMAIVEEYIAGDEFSCECISFNGKHKCLAITRKFTTGEPSFIETGHIQPSGLSPETESRIESEIFLALDALGIRNGASHSEFKITDDGQIGIIEIGARMGGDCIGSDLVWLSTGYDFVKMVVDVACGRKPELNITGDPGKAEIRFIFNESDLKVLEGIKEKTPDLIYEISEISRTDNVNDSSSRWGHYILVER